MPDLIEMIVFKVFTSWRNTEADRKSAYNNVQVGGTQRLAESQLTIMCKLAAT